MITISGAPFTQCRDTEAINNYTEYQMEERKIYKPIQCQLGILTFKVMEYCGCYDAVF